ncbi:MAG: hypothetical protein DME04_19385 [Candidatus Rokuibacteriota bacterium]|nr:MAG: hypothetical protein DME04_19385 [Candidatus Rokubacteria bacterium]
MKWPCRVIALLVSVAVLTGCATAPSSRESRGGASRVRCLSEPSRDDASVTGRPMFFLFCMESP